MFHNSKLYMFHYSYKNITKHQQIDIETNIILNTKCCHCHYVYVRKCCLQQNKISKLDKVISLATLKKLLLPFWFRLL